MRELNLGLCPCARNYFFNTRAIPPPEVEGNVILNLTAVRIKVCELYRYHLNSQNDRVCGRDVTALGDTV
jgi:hypothetical protein